MQCQQSKWPYSLNQHYIGAHYIKYTAMYSPCEQYSGRYSWYTITITGENPQISTVWKVKKSVTASVHSRTLGMGYAVCK